MLLYPDDILKKLEFDKILGLLSAKCFGHAAKELCEQLKVLTHREKIIQMLGEVEEFKAALEFGSAVPLMAYESISDELKLLETIDYVLEVEGYLRIRLVSQIMYDLERYFKDKDEMPRLKAIVGQVLANRDLLKKFDAIFDEEGNIRDSASPELRKIMTAISRQERELMKIFAALAEKYKSKGMLADTVESLRHGRRVLTVNAEHKRRVQGVIHDESSTGKTVYIEPQEVLEANNTLFELEAKRKNEIYRILKNLSGYLRPLRADLALFEKIIIRLDIIRAKALFAREYNGVNPDISSSGQVEILNMYHPLLFLLNKNSGKPTISHDIVLDESQRILVISGPNAGGKSVVLKSYGLNQLMLQAGMPVPMSPDSRLTIYSKFMIDIGDQQSLEGDLSTYSSRLINMKAIVEKARNKSLVLIDEFGSGTDPKIGGAIAEGVLNQMVKSKTHAIVTTHYSNIKSFAFDSDNIVNGAMLFDQENLAPTYQLVLGQPGSSFAFEIAHNIGLPENVLDYARKTTGGREEKIEQMLGDLQADREKLEEELDKARDDRKKLEKLIRNYEQMHYDLEIRRKKLKLEIKEKRYQGASDDERELQKVIRELKESANLEKAKSLSKSIKAQKQDIRAEISALNETVYARDSERGKSLSVGDYARIKTGTDSGKIIAIDNKKASIAIGAMVFEVKLKDLVPAQESITGHAKTINVDTSVKMDRVESSLDIRGYTRSDALASIQEFVDQAIMANLTEVKVLHGKGNGVLRKALIDKLKEYKEVRKYWHPEEEHGGLGVTFIAL